MAFHSLAALLLSGSLLALAGIHVYWAFGGKRGSSSVVPTQNAQPLFKPGLVATLAVAVVLLVATLLVLLRAGLLPDLLPVWMPLVSVWFIGVAFALRAVGEGRHVGFSKRVKDTDFARMDTIFYSPLCLVLAALAFAVASLSP